MIVSCNHEAGRTLCSLCTKENEIEELQKEVARLRRANSVFGNELAERRWQTFGYAVGNLFRKQDANMVFVEAYTKAMAENAVLRAELERIKDETTD